MDSPMGSKGYTLADPPFLFQIFHHFLCCMELVTVSKATAIYEGISAFVVSRLCEFFDES